MPQEWQENRDGFVYFYTATFQQADERPLVLPALKSKYMEAKLQFESYADKGIFKKYGILEGMKCFVERVSESKYKDLDDPRVGLKLITLTKKYDALNEHHKDKKMIFNMSKAEFFQRMIEKYYPVLADEIDKEWSSLRN